MSTLKISINENDHIQGDKKAPVVLVKYGDYECPFCRAAYYVVKQLQEALGSNLLFVFRNFPLQEVHPHAELAAETAEFCGDNGYYWEMHDLLYENQERLSAELMVELTEQLSLSTQKLEQALINGIYKEKIKTDFMGGVRSGVNGTPTFFINDQRYNGPYDFDNLLSACQQSGIGSKK
jgi:protein-disulfide isomerase